MKIIHQVVTEVPWDGRYPGYTHTVRLHTNDDETWISWLNKKQFPRGAREDELEIIDSNSVFEIYASDGEDDESSTVSIDLPRDRMFELHEWLTKRLYGGT